MADPPASFRASLGQWDLSVIVHGEDLHLSVIDGPDQASIDLPRETAVSLASFLAEQLGYFLELDEYDDEEADRG